MTKLKCPLCEANSMVLHVFKDPEKEVEPSVEDKTFAWICYDCPGVLLEYWDSNNIDVLHKYLHGDKSVVYKGQD